MCGWAWCGLDGGRHMPARATCVATPSPWLPVCTLPSAPRQLSPPPPPFSLLPPPAPTPMRHLAGPGPLPPHARAPPDAGLLTSPASAPRHRHMRPRLATVGHHHHHHHHHDHHGHWPPWRRPPIDRGHTTPRTMLDRDRQYVRIREGEWGVWVCGWAWCGVDGGTSPHAGTSDMCCHPVPVAASVHAPVSAP